MGSYQNIWAGPIYHGWCPFKRQREHHMKTDAEMGTGTGSIEEGASPGASGGRMALLVCLASRAVGEYISGLFFFSHQITSGLLRSDQQSWIITGFFILKCPPKYFGCGTSEVLFSTLQKVGRLQTQPSQPPVLVNKVLLTHSHTHSFAVTQSCVCSS